VTIDKSLRRKGHLLRARNVLKRSERIEKLEFEDRWQEGQSPFGLPKVRVVKSSLGRKKKKKKEEEEELLEEGMEATEATEEDE
jgi:small basic protein (TIGR04137 family)